VNGYEEEAFTLSDEAEQFEYLHVRQGHVKNLVDQSANLHKEVLRLLGPPTFTPDPLFEEQLSDRDEQIHQLQEYLCQRNEDGEMVNSVAYHERQIRQHQSLLKTLTTDETKQQVEEFTGNRKRLAAFESFAQDVQRLCSDLTDFGKEANASVEAINKRLPKREDIHITAVDFSVQLKQAEALLELASTKQAELNERNGKIQTELAEKGFKGDISNLLSKADAYQRAIQQSEAAVEKIKAEQERLAGLIQARKDSVDQIKSNLESERADIGTRFAAKQAGVDQLSADHKALLHSLLSDIDISGAVVFDHARFLSGLWEFIDGRKFRSTTAKSKDQRLAETLGVDGPDDFLRLLAGESIVTMDDEGLPVSLNEFVETPDLVYPGRQRELYDYLFFRQHRSAYLKILPTVRYQGKELGRLSVGQRGTFYLCLKLATESFSTPFVFDQPEDDLDNEFIIAHLLPVFREIKKYRQVIIATHNANLVVNADSDQVIIASNNDEVLSYEAGALDNSEIRKRICDILEGGEKAFLKRERRYGIRQPSRQP